MYQGCYMGSFFPYLLYVCVQQTGLFGQERETRIFFDTHVVGHRGRTFGGAALFHKRFGGDDDLSFEIGAELQRLYDVCRHNGYEIVAFDCVRYVIDLYGGFSLLRFLYADLFKAAVAVEDVLFQRIGKFFRKIEACPKRFVPSVFPAEAFGKFFCKPFGIGQAGE